MSAVAFGVLLQANRRGSVPGDALDGAAGVLRAAGARDVAVVYDVGRGCPTAAFTIDTPGREEAGRLVVELIRRLSADAKPPVMGGWSTVRVSAGVSEAPPEFRP